MITLTENEFYGKKYLYMVVLVFNLENGNCFRETKTSETFIFQIETICPGHLLAFMSSVQNLTC